MLPLLLMMLPSRLLLLLLLLLFVFADAISCRSDDEGERRSCKTLLAVPVS
jgi:hypothetical protein